MSTRDPKKIQSEVSDARHDLDRTLDAIQNRFTPGYAIDQAFQYLRGGAGGFAGNFSNKVQNNPIPITLLGVGLAWLIASDARPEPAPNSHGSSVGETFGKAGDKARSAGEKVKGAGDKFRDKASDVRHRAGSAASGARDKMEQLGEDGRYQAQRARAKADHLMHEHPLAIGALGLALGVAFAASLPSTRQEDATMGQLRDDSVRKAKEVGSDYAERAKPVAEAAEAAAEEESKRQGLHPEKSTTSNADKGQPGSSFL
ncbi:MAG: DUF3618 domain-containing protein [Marinobacter sp.]